jgi:tRNA-splicing ligase RtcB (3'-phosphate/5'-hydroxy nucleic acid ligase)
MQTQVCKPEMFHHSCRHGPMRVRLMEKIMSMIDGHVLIGWGFKPSARFRELIASANAMRSGGQDDAAIIAALEATLPPPVVEMPMRTNTLPIGVFIEAEGEGDAANIAAVVSHMDVLMRVPTIVAGAVMPDACPSGYAPGTIPVGGVAAAKDAIHPGMHSADICCSMAISIFERNMDLKQLLDAVQAVTHFGPGGRKSVIQPPAVIMQEFAANPFLSGLENMAIGHFGSQGDGNHFAYVGTVKSTGKPALVTHHGSRGFGAQLYKRGMERARKHTAIVAPRVPQHNAWIDANSDDGRSYWDALQVAREWTKGNHFAIHDLVQQKIGAKVGDRFWNEHNFVFRKSDGLYYHGKGATPSWAGYAADTNGLTLIPMNCSKPILITRPTDRADALGFAPHGAGRNFSRTQHLKAEGTGGVLSAELAALGSRGLDIRSFCGTPDLSELPSAYKSAAQVRGQIERFGLAEIVDEIVPYGSIMAGDWEKDAPWRKKKKEKAAAS